MHDAWSREAGAAWAHETDQRHERGIPVQRGFCTEATEEGRERTETERQVGDGTTKHTKDTKMEYPSEVVF